MKKKSEPQLFIIESLKMRDEEKHLYEGDIISRMLSLSGKTDTKYFYIRTRREMQEMADRFVRSKHRYMHISCHADESGIETTLETITNPELSDMLRDHLHRTRLFVSACAMANEDLAEQLFSKSEILSFAGPSVPIDFDDAAAFWVSFYHLMFKKDDGSMAGEYVKEVLNKLSILYDAQMNYFVRKKDSGLYNMHTFPIKDEGGQELSV